LHTVPKALRVQEMFYWIYDLPALWVI